MRSNISLVLRNLIVPFELQELLTQLFLGHRFLGSLCASIIESFMPTTLPLTWVSIFIFTLLSMLFNPLFTAPDLLLDSNPKQLTIVNLLKSELESRQSIEWLSTIIDTKALTFTVLNGKILRLKSFLLEVLNNTYTTS